MNTPHIYSLADRQATAEIACPSCKANADMPCLRPDGVRYSRTHSSRIVAYRNKIGGEEFTRRHSTHVMLRRNPVVTI